MFERAIEILNCLSRRGDMSINEIAECVGDPYPTVYYTIRRLEEDGLVERSSYGPNRVVRYRITPAGLRWLGST